MDVALNLLPLALVDHGADVIAGLVSGTNLDAVRHLGGNGHRTVIDRALHQHARGRVAGLARIVHHMTHTAFDRLVIGIGEDHVGTLAAQFQRDAFQRFSSGFGNGFARTGRACERHHLHIGMGRQLAPHAHAIAVDQVKHARGQARIMAEFSKDHGVQGRFLRRFQHAGAAGQNGGDHL